MPFSEILGHTDIVANLRNMVDSDRMPHALLFTEKPGCGALPLALATLEYMFSRGRNPKVAKLVHPDVHFTFPINVSTTIGGDKRGELEQFYPAWRELVLGNPYFSETDLYKAFGIENKLGTISVAEASSIMKKLIWFGGLFLAVIAILPMLLRFTSLNFTFGGTTILIVVGVALEIVQQLESQLVMRHYKGFLE